MIFRRYGTTYQSVDLAFDAKALNEVSFRRNREVSHETEAFESVYATVRTEELTAEAEGSVQSEVEAAMLDKLTAQVEEMRGGLADGEVLVVENEQGHDHPKPRQETKNVIVQGENKLHFHYTIRPPLRVSVRKKSG